MFSRESTCLQTQARQQGLCRSLRRHTSACIGLGKLGEPALSHVGLVACCMSLSPPPPNDNTINLPAKKRG